MPFIADMHVVLLSLNVPVRNLRATSPELIRVMPPLNGLRQSLLDGDGLPPLLLLLLLLGIIQHRHTCIRTLNPEHTSSIGSGSSSWTIASSSGEYSRDWSSMPTRCSSAATRLPISLRMRYCVICDQVRALQTAPMVAAVRSQHNSEMHAQQRDPVCDGTCDHTVNGQERCARYEDSGRQA